MTTADATIVVPCFNEAMRLDPEAVASLARDGRRVLLINDGSTDSTLGLLRTLEEQHDAVDVLDLQVNRGKAEAVRRGLQFALERGAEVVGYADADMSTPVSELVRLIDIALDDARLKVVLGSRVTLLGRDVERSVLHHYRGRVFATAAGIILRIGVYDTQCGAKVFRNAPALHQALSEPFHSRWAFDVELLGRLLRGRHGVPGLPKQTLVEVPLLVWHDVAGTKMSFTGALRAGLELAVIARSLAVWDA